MLIRDKVEDRVTTRRIVPGTRQLRRLGDRLGANLDKQGIVDTKNSPTKADHEIDHILVPTFVEFEKHARCHDGKSFIILYIGTFEIRNAGSFVTAPRKIALQKIL